MKIITKVFHDFDRPSTSLSTPLEISKGEKVSPKKSITLSPPDKEKKRAEFRQLMDDLAPKPFTPEESTKEKDRILSMLDKLEFDDNVRDIFDAIIKNQFVPKELIEAGRKIAKSEAQILSEIFAQSGRMNLEDQKTIAFALSGGVENLKQVIGLLPQTIIEVLQKDGSIKKVTGNTMLDFIPKNIRQLVQ